MAKKTHIKVRLVPEEKPDSPFLLPKPLHEILDKDELNKNSGFNCYLNLYTKNQINELKIK